MQFSPPREGPVLELDPRVGARSNIGPDRRCEATSLRRRKFLTHLGCAASALLWSLAEPLIVRAEMISGATRKIGVVTLGVTQSSPLFKAFITGLRELGYEPGKNIVIMPRDGPISYPTS